MALKYRHELKYVVSAQQIAVLRSRIRYIMDLDEHVGEEGKYTIRSAYLMTTGIPVISKMKTEQAPGKNSGYVFMMPAIRKFIWN